MKILRLLTLLLLAAITINAQVPSPRPAEPAKEPVNYVIRVEWKDTNKPANRHLEILTAEGQFNLDTVQKNTVKINNNDIPVTLRMSGNLSAFNAEKGKLQLFLGRTFPYVTGTLSGSIGSGATSTYQQMSTGLNNTFVVKFGQPLVIQSDEDSEITVLVKRAEN